RILQEFRREQLITLEQRRLTLLDVEKLQGISGLTPDYLRPGTTPSGLMHYFDPAGILPQGFDRRGGNPLCRLELSRDAGWFNRVQEDQVWHGRAPWHRDSAGSRIACC